MAVPNRRTFLAFGLILAALAVLVGLAVREADPASAGTGLVPDRVRTDVPVVVDGTVFDLEQMGDRILVSGSFTSVRPAAGEAPIAQKYLFAYDIDTGELDRDFLPQIDREVEQIVVAPDASAVYLVGAFNNINGEKARKIARITADGVLDTGFRANADSKATAVAISPDGTRLFVGGTFTMINGIARAGLAEVDAATGTPAESFTLGLSGPIGVGGSMSAKALEVTPDGRQLIVMSSSRFIGGEERWGLGKIDIAANTARMKNWRTRLYENNRDRVGGQFWFRGFALSPDGKYFVVTTSGGDRPPTNDTAVRFDVRADGSDDVQPVWITRNFDSTYSAAIDDDVVYIGGHFQYTEAPGATDPYPGDPEKSYGFGGDQDASILGNEVVARQQVAALDPDTGHSLNWNPGANGFNGVYELQVIDRGLLLGHDGDTVADKPVGRAAFFDRLNPGDGNQGGGGGDVDTLDTTITSPITGAQFQAGTTIQLEGEATAPEGVDRVQVTVFDLGTRTWLQSDGSFGADWSASVASLGSPGETRSTWSLPIVLPRDGDYEIKAKAFDRAGGKDPAQPSIRIRTVGGAVDEAPDTLITSAIVDHDARTITVSGTATDDIGVDRVRLVFILRDQLGTEYLREDGSLGDWYAFSPTLTNPGETGTNWSIEVTVPVDGTWRMQAFAVDTSGQKDASKSSATRRVGDDGVDEPPTLITIDQPAKDSTLTANQGFVMRGLAEDDFGVDRVTVRIYNYATGQGLQLGGTIAGVDGVTAQVDATLANRGATSTAYEIAVPGLPPGRYRVEARAIDDFPQTKAIAQNITVLADAGEQLPVIGISEPVAGEITDPAVNARGRATDNRGVARVEVGYYFYGNEDQTRGWLRADNTTISNVTQYRDATLASPGAAATDWSHPTVTLPFEGQWLVRARAWDDAGQPSGSYVQSVITYRPNNEAPTLEIQSLTEGDLIAPGPLAVNGVIFDDRGVQRVRYYVRRAHVNEGPNPNPGVTTANWFDAFVTQPGGTRSNWAFTTPDLEPGQWFVYIQPQDDSGLWGERISINFTVGFEGNAAPDTRITTPRNLSADATSLQMSFAGTATDDTGVAEVRVLIWDNDRRGFVMPDGSLTSESALAYRSASVDQVGATSTTWTYEMTMPAEGRYWVRSFAYDTDGMRQTASRYAWFWMTPGDAFPTTETVSPDNGATVGSPFTITGTAVDDQGVTRVRLLIRNEDNRSEGLRADGTIGAGQWLELDITPGTTVNWSRTIDVPAGRWRIDVLSYDATGKYDYAPARIVTVP